MRKNIMLGVRKILFMKKNKTISDDITRELQVCRADYLVIGNKYICSVCEKQFVATEDNKYIINGGYTCSWKCFLQEFRKRQKQNI